MHNDTAAAAVVVAAAIIWIITIELCHYSIKNFEKKTIR